MVTAQSSTRRDQPAASTAAARDRRPRGAEPLGSQRNFLSAMAKPKRPHAATKASDPGLNAGPSTMGEKQSWNDLTNGFSGKKLPTEFNKLFFWSLTTNTSEMNASGKITAFAARTGRFDERRQGHSQCCERRNADGEGHDGGRHLGPID